MPKTFSSRRTIPIQFSSIVCFFPFGLDCSVLSSVEIDRYKKSNPSILRHVRHVSTPWWWWWACLRHFRSNKIVSIRIGMSDIYFQLNFQKLINQLLAILTLFIVLALSTTFLLNTCSGPGLRSSNTCC